MSWRGVYNEIWKLLVGVAVSGGVGSLEETVNLDGKRLWPRRSRGGWPRAVSPAVDSTLAGIPGEPIEVITHLPTIAARADTHLAVARAKHA